MTGAPADPAGFANALHLHKKKKQQQAVKSDGDQAGGSGDGEGPAMLPGSADQPMHTLLPQQTLLHSRAEMACLLSQVQLSEVCKLPTAFSYHITTCCLCFEQVLEQVLKCLSASQNEISGSVVLVSLYAITQA